MPSEQPGSGTPRNTVATRSIRNQKKHRTRKRIRLVVTLLVIICAAGLFIFSTGVNFKVTAEAGSPIPRLEDFIKGDSSEYSLVTDLSGIDMNSPGRTKVTVKGKLLPYFCVLEVKDTVPPEGSVQNLKGVLNKEISAEDFFSSISDATAVTADYKSKPDFSKAGEQRIELLLTDAAGNSSAYSAVLELVDDKEAPVIEGVKNRTIFIGETIAYKAGVTVTDNIDPEPKLTIDNSQVDMSTAGIYPVTYTATDFAGNTTSITINLKVEEQPIGYGNIEEMNQKVDALLEKIIKPEMTDIEKLFTIFVWIRDHIKYQNAHVQFDYVGEAIKCLNGQAGDCYTCAAGFRAMAEALGFETKDVIGTYKNHHYWNMVKVNGEWYHIDSTRLYVNSFVCFLGTDEELEWFSTTQRPGYYNRDMELYPSTPAKSPADAKYANGTYTLVLNN